MTWFGEGVWLSVRLSSTLQLYHANTYQHLQDLNLQPYIERMIGERSVHLEEEREKMVTFILAKEKAHLHFVHISAITIAHRHLWIGTGNGIVISIPLSERKFVAHIAD